MVSCGRRVCRRSTESSCRSTTISISLKPSERTQAIALLDAWLTWARRSRIRSFVKLAKTISQHYQGIVATLTRRLQTPASK
jgi:transposase